MKCSNDLRRRSCRTWRSATPVIFALALTACADGPEVAATDPLNPSAAGTSQPQSEETAGGDGGAGALAAILGGIATGGLIAAGTGGDVGQSVIAAATAAAASEADPDAVALAGAIQTATAPMTNANGYTAANPSGGSGSCDPLLAQADNELAAAGPRIGNNIQRMEALMATLNKQIAIIDQHCPHDNFYSSMRQERVQQFEATQRACDGTATKGRCVAQMPGEYENIGGNGGLHQPDSSGGSEYAPPSSTPGSSRGPRACYPYCSQS